MVRGNLRPDYGLDAMLTPDFPDGLLSLPAAKDLVVTARLAAWIPLLFATCHWVDVIRVLSHPAPRDQQG